MQVKYQLRKWKLLKIINQAPISSCTIKSKSVLIFLKKFDYFVKASFKRIQIIQRNSNERSFSFFVMSFLLKPKRWLAPMDYINLLYGINMQIVVEFQDPKYVESAVYEFINCMNSFRCQGNLLYIRSNDNIPVIHQIPPGLKTLKDVAIWMNKEHQAKWNPLATIACDYNRIVVNSCHSCNDGTRCIQLVKHICEPDEYNTMPCTPVATSLYHKYKKEIFSHPNTAIYCAGDSHICRLQAKPVDKSTKPKFLLPHFECPISELMGYDPSTKHVKSLSEAQWIAQGLAHTLVEQNYDFKDFGISTVLDLRRFFPPQDAQDDPGCQECIASIPVTCTPNLDTSLADFGKLMRENFNMRIQRKDYLSHIRSVWEAIFKPWKNPIPPGIALESSSMGPVPFHSPVKDVWISLITPDDIPLSQTSFLTYTKVNEDTQERTFVGQFQANSQEYCEADKFLKLIEFGMKNFDYKMTVREALDSLDNFRKKI